ncbi:MAG TPA: hypothetical protein VF552_15250 [Allosphingosinicella sp.]|jgi:hypothetical protein
MKSLVFAVAGLGVGGAAIMGADSPDYDGTVRMSRAEVYAAFSAIAPEGTVVIPETDENGRKVSVRVAKDGGESIRYEVLLDDRAVVTAELEFEPAGDAQTRMTAELDIDGYALGSSFQTEAGVAMAMVPDGVVDAQFAELMREMVAEVEAGRPLRPVGLDAFGVERQSAGRGSASASVEERRRAVDASRRAAVAPSTSTEPMIDPNRAAEDYLAGRESRRSSGYGSR